MKKRIAAIFLVLCMLMGTAAAEGSYQASLSMRVSEQAMENFLSKSTDMEAAKAKTLATGLAKLAETTKLQLNVQNDGGYAALSLKDTLLLDMGLFGTDLEAGLFTNLTPGYYMDISVTEEDAAQSEAAWETLNSADWTKILADLVAAGAAWGDEIPCQVETGNFLGDTYEGGVLRRTYTFDDSSLARLMEKLMNVLDAHGFHDDWLNDLLGEEGMFSSLAEKNAAVAQENRYRYLWHFVKDASGADIGMSVVALEGDQQVMTISLATASNGVRVVWGYGMNEQNCYIDAVIIDDGSDADTTAIAYSLTVYQDAQRQGFRAVEPYIDYVALMYSGTARWEQNAEQQAWAFEVESIDPKAPESDIRLVLKGTHTQDTDETEQVISLYSRVDEGADPFVTAVVNVKPCEPMAWNKEDMQPYASDDMTLMDELMEKPLQELTVKLFKLIPPQVLTYFMY